MQSASYSRSSRLELYAAANLRHYNGPMCYSAQVESKWKQYVREMEARIALSDFRELAQLRLADPARYRLPRGFDLQFADPQSPEEQVIKDLIDQYRKIQVTKCQRQCKSDPPLIVNAKVKVDHPPGSFCSGLLRRA